MPSSDFASNESCCLVSTGVLVSDWQGWLDLTSWDWLSEWMGSISADFSTPTCFLGSSVPGLWRSRSWRGEYSGSLMKFSTLMLGCLRDSALMIGWTDTWPFFSGKEWMEEVIFNPLCWLCCSLFWGMDTVRDLRLCFTALWGVDDISFLLGLPALLLEASLALGEDLATHTAHVHSAEFVAWGGTDLSGRGDGFWCWRGTTAQSTHCSGCPLRQRTWPSHWPHDTHFLILNLLNWVTVPQWIKMIAIKLRDV